MKSRVIYIFLSVTIFLVIIFSIKGFERNVYVKGNGRIQANPKVWDSTIANNINKSLITLNVDDKQLKNYDTKNSLYMNESRGLMIAVDLITESFHCATNLYNKEVLVVEKGQERLEFVKDQPSMKINNEIIDLEASLTEKGGDFFLPIEALEKAFNYDYNWNVSENTGNLVATKSYKVLPSYYNYIDSGKVPDVKDQGRWGTCWSFATLTALESSLLPEENYDFSEDHMTLNNSYNLSPNEGGEYTMSISYLAAWQGPVLEIQDPYGDGKTEDGLLPVKHLQEAQIIKSKDYETIKEMVFKYGGVQSSLYTSMVNSTYSSSYYYNKKTNSYCYTGNQIPNHDVVIVGWDDDYPKENFNVSLEGDGAFICRNSWGADFGDNGTFYVSYYDSVIGIHNVVYTKIEDTDNYDNIYQSDLCGWVGQLGYGKDSAYFANIYTNKGNERLDAVAFYATGENTEYSVYISRDFKDTTSLNILQKPVASGTFKNAGYYTVDLEKEINLNPGERYAIIVKIKTPNATRPIAIEYANDKKTASVDLSDGEGYISLGGFDWENTEEKHGCNICLKGFTSKIN